MRIFLATTTHTDAEIGGTFFFLPVNVQRVSESSETLDAMTSITAMPIHWKSKIEQDTRD
jgi:hypothetical protein